MKETFAVLPIFQHTRKMSKENKMERKEQEEQYKRISRYENISDRHKAALKNFEDALSEFKNAQKSFEELKEYYGSDDFILDFECSNRPEFPKDLKCGVLSEDGIYDLIAENYGVGISMMETALDIIKNN